MKEKIFFKVIAAVSLMAVLSCAKELEMESIPAETQEQAGDVKTYSMSVIAGKGDAGTKALSLDGKTLSATWAEGEEVDVYKDETLLGTLAAQSSGPSTRLAGSITGNVETGDELTLKFLSPDYENQEGTLEYISTHCDYATATVTASVDGSLVTASDASFESRQAIVKFILKDASGAEDVSAKPLKVNAGGTEITVTPTDATNEMYVAVPAVGGKTITLMATLPSNAIKGYTRHGVTFVQGKYYVITVRMTNVVYVHNESELNAAIAANAYIFLANDITVNDVVRVGRYNSQPITLDLNGFELKLADRSTRSAEDEASVIEVDGTLTIRDTGGSGKITGGRAYQGGGIYNTGTLYFEAGKIHHCTASDWGGGICNFGTLVMSGGEIEFNQADEGAGIWSNGRLVMTGGQLMGNAAQSRGGGLANYGQAEIKDVSISYWNTAEYGGAIWNGRTMTLEASTISLNNGSIEGGGIYSYGPEGFESTLIVKGSQITENTAPTCGGIINLCELVLSDNTVIRSNISTASGGGGLVNHGQADMIDSYISNNQSAENGGGVYNTGILRVSGGGFSRNEATLDGGGIWNSGSLTVNSATMDHNSATGNEQSLGGAIYMAKGVTSQASLENMILMENISKAGGGALFIGGGDNEDARVTIKDATIGLNYSYGYGAGIANNGSLTLCGSNILQGNRSYGDGGGIWNNGSLTLGDGALTVSYNQKGRNTFNGDLFLCEGKVIGIDGSISGSSIGVSLQSNEGTVTSGFGGRDESVFFADNTDFVTLGTSGGEVVLTARTDRISYIEREWNEAAFAVVETIKTLPATYTTLAGNQQYEVVSSSGESVFLVKDQGVRRARLEINSGTAHLVICDGASLKGDVVIKSGATLHVYGQVKNTGVLDAPGGEDPSIRGGGTLVVHGSTLTAHIGIIGNNVIIFGGLVTSHGSGDGMAGIGGDSDTGAGSFTVYGGTVEATGGSGGAGIGGGSKKSNGPVNIYGGDVKATGKGRAAGIGSGNDGNQNNPINIYGGHVYATGSWHTGYDVPGWGGAGIGSGAEGKGGVVNISGGYVEAYGIDGGAGIGGGAEAKGGVTTISGGKVYVTVSGGAGSACIGGGREADGGEVNITGGHVQIVAKGDLAIGTGDESTTATVRITGGTVDMTRDYSYTVYWPLIGNDPLYVSDVIFELGPYLKVKTDGPVSYDKREEVCLAEKQEKLFISPCEHSFDASGQCRWCLKKR